MWKQHLGEAESLDALHELLRAARRAELDDDYALSVRAYEQLHWYRGEWERRTGEQMDERANTIATALFDRLAEIPEPDRAVALVNMLGELSDDEQTFLQAAPGKLQVTMMAEFAAAPREARQIVRCAEQATEVIACQRRREAEARALRAPAQQARRSRGCEGRRRIVANRHVRQRGAGRPAGSRRQRAAAKAASGGGDPDPPGPGEAAGRADHVVLLRAGVVA
jgi:hypothetical protein